MSWSIPEIRNNASILYNHLCSDHSEKVYVNKAGQLQVDVRSVFFRWLCPKGDYSRKKTDEVAIRTLRRLLNAWKKD